MKTVLGKCLCEKVELEFQVNHDRYHVCHCSMCRRWGGSLAFGVEASSIPKITGESDLTLYSSSDWAERAFCRHCGTHIYYRLKGQDYFNVPLGILIEADDFRADTEIFYDRKPHNYSITGETKKMTEAQVLEAFGFAPEGV